MTIKRIICLSLFIVLNILPFATDVQSADTTTFNLRLGTWWPKSHIMSAAMEAWIKDIEIATEGKVKTTYFPAGQLATDKDALEKVSSGIADMAPIICEYFQAEFPLSQVNGMPFLFSDSIQGGIVVNKMKERFEAEFEANNLKIMWGFVPPPYPPLMSKKPIQSMEDWKGVRVKTAGSIQAEAIKALGGTPLVIFAGEMYTSLQRGTVDGIIIPMSAASSFKMQEVINHVTNIGINTTPIYLSMNLKQWNKIPEEIQNKIEKANNNAAERTGKLYDDAEKEAIESWKQRGIKFYKLSDSELKRWKSETDPIWDAWIRNCEAKNLESRELAEEAKRLAREVK